MTITPLKINTHDEEWKIQQAIIKELQRLGWFVKATHGNAYQSGFPDLFCCHYDYGHRWVEVKKPKGWKFTSAQLENFPKFCAHRSGIWIAQTHVNIQKLLMEPCNWQWFLLNVRSANT